MPRINIEDKLWADQRFDALKIILGSEYLALGYMLKIFKLAQESWLKNEQQLIPHETWNLYDFSSVEKVGLVEKFPDGIYVKGSQENFIWLKNKQEAGRKSAETRKLKYGTSQPKSPNRRRTATEHLFDNRRTATEPPTPTPTLNTCTSNKNMIKKESNMSDDIVNVWNQTLTHAPISRLTDKRKRLINAQLKKYPDMEHWQTCFEMVKDSDFLTGKNNSSWKCNFDWVLNENNRVKIIEGCYKNKQSQQTGLKPLTNDLED